MKKSILALVAGTLVLGGALSAKAQVYSVNAVGFVNLTLPPQFSMIANPLSGATNTIAVLLKNAPDGSAAFKFNPNINNYDFTSKGSSLSGFDGAWDNTSMTLLPGEGIFFYNNSTSNYVAQFVGEVLSGLLVNPLPANFSLVSSQVPQSGLLETELGFPAQDGDAVFIYSSAINNYNFYTRNSSSWDLPGGQPTISVGQSFFVFKAGPANWTRNFSISGS